MVLREGKNKNLGARCFAGIIDYTITFLLIFLCIYALGESLAPGVYTVTGVTVWIIPLIWFIYFPLCESIGAQTPGKKLFNLYVVDRNRRSASIIQTFMRRLLDPFELMFMGIPAVLAINHSEKNQRLGDVVAGTFVVSTDTI